MSCILKRGRLIGCYYVTSRCYAIGFYNPSWFDQWCGQGGGLARAANPDLLVFQYLTQGHFSLAVEKYIAGNISTLWETPKWQGRDDTQILYFICDLSSIKLLFLICACSRSWLIRCSSLPLATVSKEVAAMSVLVVRNTWESLFGRGSPSGKLCHGEAGNYMVLTPSLSSRKKNQTPFSVFIALNNQTEYI